MNTNVLYGQEINPKILILIHDKTSKIEYILRIKLTMRAFDDFYSVILSIDQITEIK